jgi:CBS domain-containing protein
VEGAAGSPQFLRRLERLVGEIALPVGVFGRLQTTERGDQEVVDVKRGGIQPINDMARIVALRAGVRAVSTVRRLREAAAAGELDRDVAEGLEEALSLLRGVRNRHQAAQWISGQPVDDLVAPEDLGPLERKSVRDAFRLVRDVRRHVAGDVQPRLLGR